MAYEVLARKWRPQQFADVVGQDHVTETLRNAIKSDRIAHAYLFVGPRGIGKTSIARVFAKALNCETGPTEKPCGKCNSCIEITEGRSLDVLEIDGASNRGIDQVRDLRDAARYMPASGKYRIYIIDEVHMLTTEAFNALLKTLEEPPDHVKFFFATTEPQKILATILSRCQRFDLRKIQADLIVKRLVEIAKAEKAKVTDGALLAIARGAEGGLRDAESALDQLISFKGLEIEENDVLSVFGLVSGEALAGMVDAILSGDVPALMKAVAELDSAGKDTQRLVVDLLGYFRDLLVCSYAGDSATELDVAGARVEQLKAQAQKCSPERLLKIADILIDTDGRLRYALSKRTLLETSLIRCARAAGTVSIDRILSEIAALRGGMPDGEDQPGSTAVHAGGPAACTKRAQGPTSDAAGAAGDVGVLRSKWHEIVDCVGRTAPLARTALLDACPLEIDGNTVVIGFDSEFAEHIKRMESKRHLLAARNAIKRVIGHEVKLEFRVLPAGVELPTDTKTNSGPGPEEEATDAAAAERGPEEESTKPASRKSIEEWMKDDAIRKTLEAFNGEIVDVRE